MRLHSVGYLFAYLSCYWLIPHVGRVRPIGAAIGIYFFSGG